ncbi:MAG: ABC transporter ATP-binding protein [Phycisphaerales bacterium]|nr:ABC transporter ATP-binding protein [Phycisphaerales bacterium]
MTVSEFAIDLDHVAKTYRGRVRALRGIQMRVRRGEIFGLLGPNGAGKSTLVKVLMTVIRPTECRGTMLGEPVGRKGPLGRVGYLPEHHRFADYLTGAQVLDYYGALAGVPRPLRRRRSAELLRTVGMSAWARRKVGSYSKGMRQRIGIAQALVNDPELVLLDEPTDGVDPVGRRDIREILQNLKARGKTVFLNSHLLSELEMVCDRVAILVQGAVSAQGTIDELTRDQQRYEVEVDDRSAPALPAAVAAHPAAVVAGAVARVATTDAAAVQPVIDAVRHAGLTIRAVRAFRPSLEDLFMRAVTDPEGHTLTPGARGGARP